MPPRPVFSGVKHANSPRWRRSLARFAGAAAFAATTAWAAPRPAVVELFTSQGCSSCPPAERLLGELADRPDVLALAYHVDYWNDLGWRDTFSFAGATERQRRYAAALRARSVYTPQVIIDGTRDLVGSDAARIGAALRATRSGVPVDLAREGSILRIHVGDEAGGAPAAVLLVAYQDRATSAIGRGENAGRTLTEHHIVRAIRVLGRYTGAALEYRVAAASLPLEATDVAVLVQTADSGPIVGATHGPLR